MNSDIFNMYSSMLNMQQQQLQQQQQQAQQQAKLLEEQRRKEERERQAMFDAPMLAFERLKKAREIGVPEELLTLYDLDYQQKLTELQSYLGHDV